MCELLMIEKLIFLFCGPLTCLNKSYLYICGLVTNFQPKVKMGLLSLTVILAEVGNSLCFWQNSQLTLSVVSELRGGSKLHSPGRAVKATIKQKINSRAAGQSDAFSPPRRDTIPVFIPSERKQRLFCENVKM